MSRKEKLDFFKINSVEKIYLVITILMGIVIYYQMPVNWLTNPDTVWNAIYFRNGHGGEKVNGRLLQIAMDLFRFNMITPVLTTVVCIILLAVTGVIIARIFSCQRQISYILIGMLLLFVPCTSSSLTYYYCSDSFMLAFLLSVLSVYIVQKVPDCRGMALSAILLVASLYLYQAYVCVALTIAVLLLIYDLFREKSVKESLIQFIKIMITCAISMLTYAVSFSILRMILNIEVREDRGFGFSIMRNFIVLVREAYINWYQYLFGDMLLNNHFGRRGYINILVVIITVILLVTVMYYRRITDWKRIGLVMISVILIPLVEQSITVIAPDVDHYGATGIIMIPTMVFVYIFPVVLSELLVNNKSRGLLTVGSALFVGLYIWNSIIFTNLCISSMQIQQNKTNTVANLMVEQLVGQYGYAPGQKLLVSGSMEDGMFPTLYGWTTEAIKGTSASYGFMWDTFYGNESCWIGYLNQFKGMNYEPSSEQFYRELMKDDEYINMPLFPNEGSINMIGDTIVVKMSNIELE